MVKIVGNITAAIKKKMGASTSSVPKLKYKILFNLVVGQEQTPVEIEAEGIPLESIIHANPFLQTQTIKRQKCQIDFLIQTKEGGLYVCEIKFRKDIEEHSAVITYTGKFSIIKNKE